MRFPSLLHLATEARRVAQRFPLTLLCAGLVCVAGCSAIAYSGYEEVPPDWVFPLLSAALLGVPLTLAVRLAAERYRWSASRCWLALAGALGLLAGWVALAPAQPNQVWYTRLALLLLTLHLAVAAAPYLAELRRGADTPGFWRYNETLFRRLLTAALYSGVLFAGGALALVAVRELLNVTIESESFGYLFVLLGAGFNTWFLLAGVPPHLAALEQDVPYPRGLKVFTQFVLLPLVVLYVGILYAYLGRILWLRALPQGWVSTLILALAVAGILALLLIHPLRHSADNTWIRTFARWFYRALFPLLGLLAVAIGVRIHAYGLTEERYFVVVLAAWLLGMACYFLWRRGQGIIWVPVSLAVLAGLAAAGPWGAFSLAERSQLRQLRELTSRYHLLQNGHLDGAARRLPRLPRRDQARLASIFDFFSARQALGSLQPQFAGSLSLPDSLRPKAEWEQREWLAGRPFALSGFNQYTARQYYGAQDVVTAAGDTLEEASTNFYTRDLPKVYALGQGRYWLNNLDVNIFNSRPEADSVLATVAARTGTFRLRASERGRTLQLQRQAAGGWQTQLQLSLAAPTDSLVRLYGPNSTDIRDLPRPVALQAKSGPLRLQLFISQMSRHELGRDTTYYCGAEGLLQLE